MKLTFPSLKGYKEIKVKTKGKEVLFEIEDQSALVKLSDLYSLALTLFTPEQLDKIMIEKMIEVSESKRQMRIKVEKDMKKGEEIVVTYIQTIPNKIIK